MNGLVDAAIDVLEASWAVVYLELDLVAVYKLPTRRCWCGLTKSEHIDAERDFRPSRFPYISDSIQDAHRRGLKL